ncbi:hypothetical protein GALMADRAFT_1163511 [Galerina marginata CBS 339.88]|uniref:Protein kinase domain-containing protein n=1 Tax=Galerina marginata (strain CBS 339.88) TaxID=685588 RepID=A0A067TLC5_GALM3|nr:hypothetical protein GALMADRAFT_1163511 [Galerina marginata CBS 339.88]
MAQLDDEDVSLERQVYKGCEYRIYSALNKQSGKIVSMKVYEGSRAKERCLESAKFMIERRVMHPNIPYMIAVSALKSEMSFLIFDGEYGGTVDRMLSQALKKNLKQSLIMGLQTVAGLSSGLEYLQDLKYPFASVGLNHFVVLSCKGKGPGIFPPTLPTDF